MSNLREKYPGIVEKIKNEIDTYEYFMKNIKNFFETTKVKIYVHSLKSRIKDIDHILEKVERKNIILSKNKAPTITAENILTEITDIAGIRVLHLHQSQFEIIHNAIMSAVENEEYALLEKPKAYTWDPESKIYFKSLGLTPHLKHSFYTSIHYLLTPNAANRTVCCEVQVRTLLEEVWGEVDHTMNYPKEHKDYSCKQQIKVLARLIGAGSHLADSIMKTYQK